MTIATTDLGPSWLRSLPDSQPVIRREVHACTVAALFDGYFSARVQGERRREYFDTSLVAVEDRLLLAVGARFWRVAEWTRPGEVTWAIRFQRPGRKTPEALFLPRPQETP